MSSLRPVAFNIRVDPMYHPALDMYEDEDLNRITRAFVQDHLAQLEQFATSNKVPMLPDPEVDK